MKLAITRTICVLLLITGLVFQPLFFAGNPISSRIEANSDSSIPAAIPLGTSIGPDAAAGQVAGSIAYDIDANRLMMAGDRSSLEPDIVQLGMVTNSVTISRPSPRLGVFKPVTLLVDFSDRPANSLSTRTYYQNLWFSETGTSVTTFLKENSLNRFDCQGVVYWNATDNGWIRAPKSFSYYFSVFDFNKYVEFRDDMLAIVDPWIDFSQHDVNHDGICDGLIFVWAGDAGDAREMALAGAPNYRDGIAVTGFCFTTEYQRNPLDQGILTFNHEYSHLLGTYDLYDYDLSSMGAGVWSFMGSPYYWHFDAFNKDLLGWLNPTTVIVNQECVLSPVESTGRAIKILISGRPNEYFLLENRQNIGSFEHLPGYGLLIWHIDESVDTGNNNEWYPGHTNTGHYLAAVEQADSLWELEKNINYGNASDIFSPDCFFTPNSVPNSRAYDGTDSNLYITNIHYEGQNVVFTISFGQPPIPLPPSVETTTVVSLTSNSVKLNGLINPNSSNTNCWFEWGMTPAYGHTTVVQSVGSGTATISVSAQLTGMTPSTTYHYRVVGQNSLGTTYGADKPFTTPPPVTAYTFSFAPGWNMITLPLVTASDPNEAFTALPPGWSLFAWDPLGGRYLDKDEILLKSGQGYWLKTSASSFAITGMIYEGQLAMDLSVGWNMVGQPYLTPLSWSGARISYQGSPYSLDQAAALGLISNALYAWDGSSYVNNWGQSLPVGQGFWLRAKLLCQLVFSKP